MVEQELRDLITQIKKRGCEEQTTEVKAAHKGCPEKLYDTISAFSNQDSGGTIVFGLDEKNDFAEVGVYDPQDLQKKIMEACEQMTPIVRPVFTVCDKDDHVFVSAEIPPLDITERPCFKTARGRMQGSFIRVGDADKPMTEYEIYSFEAFRKKYRDDIRTLEDVSMDLLDKSKIEIYLALKQKQRPNLALLEKNQQYELNGITRSGKITMLPLLLFGLYPQATFPQLGIIASVVPGKEIGDTDSNGNRFIDSKRIEGTIPEMLEGAVTFVGRNMQTAIRIDPITGERVDTPQYPLNAVREVILNALVHRDYSIHTENMPIQLLMFSDRLEVINPGGLYGRITVDQLGAVQPETRNPSLVTAMEIPGESENRYSGIPTIRKMMADAALPSPEFIDNHVNFKVILYNRNHVSNSLTSDNSFEDKQDAKNIIDFCRTPRSRDEIVSYIGIPSRQYALKRYLEPLVESGEIQMTNPGSPRSRSQRFVAADKKGA